MFASNKTLHDSTGKAISVRHIRVPAIQYDFYIPEVVFGSEQISNFTESLLELVPGGTILNNLTGIWNRENEVTRIYRVILKYDNTQIKYDDLRMRISQTIDSIMARWANTAHQQEAFMYTETDIMMNISEISNS